MTNSKRLGNPRRKLEDNLIVAELIVVVVSWDCPIGRITGRVSSLVRGHLELPFPASIVK